MPSDDHPIAGEITADVAEAGALPPPIWVPLDDGGNADNGDDADLPGLPAAGSDPAVTQIGLPTSVLAGGAGLVLLAAAIVFGLIAGRGPATSPDLPRRAAASPAAVAASRSAPPSPAPALIPRVSCRYLPATDRPVPRRATRPPATGVINTGRVPVRLITNHGELMLSLNRADAPCTVNSFLALAGQRFFDDTPCHRLTTEGLYVLQCGDPGGTGTGGPGYSFAAENLPGVRSAPVIYPAGTVAMAGGGPNVNGSQFFIVYKDTALMPTWTAFGRVTAGLDVVQGLAEAGSSPVGDGRPTYPVVITSVTPVPPPR